MSGDLIHFEVKEVVDEIIWINMIMLHIDIYSFSNNFNLIFSRPFVLCFMFYVKKKSTFLFVSIVKPAIFENVGYQHFDGHLLIFDFRLKPSLSIFLVALSTVLSLPMGSPKHAESWNSKCPW